MIFLLALKDKEGTGYSLFINNNYKYELNCKLMDFEEEFKEFVE